MVSSLLTNNRRCRTITSVHYYTPLKTNCVIFMTKKPLGKIAKDTRRIDDDAPNHSSRNDVEDSCVVTLPKPFRCRKIANTNHVIQ
ncbi:hypothetical protein TNCV_408231 [Trichonephila clavipes]|nr:hypothetical protein TNCV_408231 [Trichonephila clavipes]